MIEKIPDLSIRAMTLDDLPVVVEIDRQSFALPWPVRSYRFELTENPSAHLLVAEDVGASARRIIGYVGYWQLVDDAHISTIAVREGFRGRGIGKKLLREALRQAQALGARTASLEVRVSNQVAIDLYRKFGFEVIGRRRAYYADNGEDALLMGLSDVTAALAAPQGAGR